MTPNAHEHVKTYHSEIVVRSTKAGFTCWSYFWTEKLPRWMRGGDYYSRPERGRALIWAQPGEAFADAIDRRRQEAAS